MTHCQFINHLFLISYEYKDNLWQSCKWNTKLGTKSVPYHIFKDYKHLSQKILSIKSTITCDVVMKAHHVSF